MNVDTSLDTAHPYERLQPALILDAVEARGWQCDGRMLALNSYENRVYQVGLEDRGFLVAKFYRPDRWSNEAILEDHGFTLELASHDLPVVAPLVEANGGSLFEHAGFRYALYPRRGGRRPELQSADQLQWMGRLLGRLHLAGTRVGFEHRPTLTVESMGDSALAEVTQRKLLPPHLEQAFTSTAADVLQAVRAAYARAGAVPAIRLHGDCHPSNVLWSDDGPQLLDFDDARMGPAVQDLWMLLSGEREEMTVQFAALLEGYSAFRDFDARELHLIEALRSLRMLNYSAWLARRWDDPAFPIAFPWFGEPRYWEQQVLQLREQLAALQEPPLPVY